MNIYLITEEQDTFCIKAKNLKEAIELSYNDYLKEREEKDNEISRYYYDKILQSCSLVGELKN